MWFSSTIFICTNDLTIVDDPVNLLNHPSIILRIHNITLQLTSTKKYGNPIPYK